MNYFNTISIWILWILGLTQDLVQSQDLVNRCVTPKYEFGEYCYDHSGSGQGQTWNHAWVDCMSKGGRLVTIPDSATHNYITHNIIWSEFGKKAEVWLGAVEHYSPWKWVRTGKPLLSMTGCYEIASGDLGTEDFTIDQIIPEKCVQKCLASRFAIVQGSRCWCRETVGSYPDGKCSTPCGGDIQLSCGGESAINVYHTRANEGTYFNWTKTSFIDGFNCVAYDKDSRGWVNATCNSRNGYGYACQDKGLLHIEVYDDSKTWFEARETCAKKGPGSDLAKIDSAALSEDIAKKVMLRTNKRFWIGATNREWKWIPSQVPVIYSKWFDGYPRGEQRSCLMVKGRVGEVFSSPFSWENADCNATKPYICQYYKYKTTPSLTSTQSTTTDAETSTIKEVETTSGGTPNSSDLSPIVKTDKTSEPEQTTTDASHANTGRQEDKGGPFPMTLIVVVIVISLVAIVLVIVVVYVVRRRRSQTPNGSKPSKEKSVHFSQNPLYKSSDNAVDTDENLAVNIYGTQDDLASSLYDNPANKSFNTTGPPLTIQQPAPGGVPRYRVEGSDHPSNYVVMTIKGSRSPANDMRRSDDEYLADDTPDLYVSADQLGGGVGGISNPIYDIPSNVR
ncbi:uncharacterized protein LOC135483519 isoform X2 [Lineus longissimus]|uniref:uncharacterized protein LOC135483519 isoform X2 n=1 Tax=Lineus longissimus TaxID=88925 RepID=UPI002B4E44D1